MLQTYSKIKPFANMMYFFKLKFYLSLKDILGFFIIHMTQLQRN